MVVARIGIVIVIKRPWRLSASHDLMKDRKAPGHAEMHGQTEPAFRFRDDVLGAAREAGHALTQKPRCEIRLEGKAQVGAIERRPYEGLEGESLFAGAPRQHAGVPVRVVAR